MLGSTFANYSVLEHLSVGGMANIYLVADRSGQRFVLRLMLGEYRYAWTNNRRFSVGIEVTRKMNHPNVVKLYDSGKFRGLRYSILEYVDGPNLKEAMLRSDPQLRTNRLKILTGMAAGLSHMHETGYLHLDFKPENVVLTRAYDPKLIDFDLAIPRPERPKKVGKLSGTPMYLAPEQILQQPVDERADVFAYGITAYELLTGKKPIAGNSLDEVIHKYAEFDQHLKTPRVHAPDLPTKLERIVLKCLEKDMTRRYPSMSLVVRDLQT
jgi:serine/threonine-protein kinase